MANASAWAVAKPEGEMSIYEARAIGALLLLRQWPQRPVVARFLGPIDAPLLASSQVPYSGPTAATHSEVLAPLPNQDRKPCLAL